MTHTRRMIRTGPSDVFADEAVLAGCVEAGRRFEVACNDILSAIAA